MIKDLQEKLFGKNSEEDNLIETFYVIMKEFGYTLEELKAIPIPTFKFLIKIMNKEIKAKNKNSHRKR